MAILTAADTAFLTKWGYPPGVTIPMGQDEADKLIVAFKSQEALGFTAEGGNVSPFPTPFEAGLRAFVGPEGRERTAEFVKDLAKKAEDAVAAVVPELKDFAIIAVIGLIAVAVIFVAK